MCGVCVPVLHAVAHNSSDFCQRALDKDLVMTILVTRSLGDLRGVACVQETKLPPHSLRSCYISRIATPLPIISLTCLFHISLVSISAFLFWRRSIFFLLHCHSLLIGTNCLFDVFNLLQLLGNVFIIQRDFVLQISNFNLQMQKLVTLLVCNAP